MKSIARLAFAVLLLGGCHHAAVHHVVQTPPAAISTHPHWDHEPFDMDAFATALLRQYESRGDDGVSFVAEDVHRVTGCQVVRVDARATEEVRPRDVRQSSAGLRHQGAYVGTARDERYALLVALACP